MKTRTLLLLAVSCGLVILVAGTIQLLRVSGQTTPSAPVARGVEARAGDARITLLDVAEDRGAITATLLVGGVDDPNGVAGFTMVAPGAVRAPTGGTCRQFTVAAQRCTLMFDNAGLSGTTRQLLWRRAGEQVRWVLVADAAVATS